MVGCCEREVVAKGEEILGRGDISEPEVEVLMRDFFG